MPTTIQTDWVTQLLRRLYFNMHEMFEYKAICMKHKVCDMLDWDELDYANFQYNAGRNYLIYYTNNDETIIGELETNKMFWNWWIQNWVSRDETYCTKMMENMSNKARFQLYLELHDAKELAEEIYPEGRILSEGYKKMIGRVIKQQVSKK